MGDIYQPNYHREQQTGNISETLSQLHHFEYGETEDQGYDREALVYHCLCLLSVAMVKTMNKVKLGRSRCSNHSLSGGNRGRDSSRARSLRAEAAAEGAGKCCFQACFSWFVQPAFF